METYSKHITVDEVKEIIGKYYGVKDFRLHCIVDKGVWNGLSLGVYDKSTKACEVFAPQADDLQGGFTPQ
jgi:hypothetical protein